jgi:hypothetical protein
VSLSKLGQMVPYGLTSHTSLKLATKQHTTRTGEDCYVRFWIS